MTLSGLNRNSQSFNFALSLCDVRDTNEIKKVNLLHQGFLGFKGTVPKVIRIFRNDLTSTVFFPKADVLVHESRKNAWC